MLQVPWPQIYRTLYGPSTIINGVPSKVRVDIPRDEARPSEVPSARCDCGCEFRLLTGAKARAPRAGRTRVIIRHSKIEYTHTIKVQVFIKLQVQVGHVPTSSCQEASAFTVGYLSLVGKLFGFGEPTLVQDSSLAFIISFARAAPRRQ